MLVYKTTNSREYVPKEHSQIFNDILNVFDIDGDILNCRINADSREHDVRIEQVLPIYEQKQPKAKQSQVKMHTIFDEVFSRYGVSPDPAKVNVLMDMPLSKTKRELKV